MKKVIVIAGPTASGKSAFASKLALKTEGVVINADSMQVYEDLPILSASPQKKEKEGLTHYLYNYVGALEEYSVARYIDDIKEVLSKIENNKVPIIVGGTGLYIYTLIYGISKIPDIDKDIREYSRKRILEIGNNAYYDELVKLDQCVLGKIYPGDSQRMVRAYEVIMQTGKSIFEYRNEGMYKPFPEVAFKVILLKPSRSYLYESCNLRFEKFINLGAVEEVEALIRKENRANLKSISTTLGFNEISDFLKNKLTLEDAINLAKTKTRQYAKRQCTWFNHQIKEKLELEFSSMAEYELQTENILNNISLLE